jgi:hypothetical protein
MIVRPKSKGCALRTVRRRRLAANVAAASLFSIAPQRRLRTSSTRCISTQPTTMLSDGRLGVAMGALMSTREFKIFVRRATSPLSPQGSDLTSATLLFLCVLEMGAAVACGTSDAQTSNFADAGPSTSCDVQADKVLAVQCTGDPTPSVSCGSSAIAIDGSVAEGCTVFLHDAPESTCGGQASDASCCVDTCTCSGGLCSTGF